MTSWHEYQLRLKGYEQKIQERWIFARWAAWQNVLLSPNIKPAHKPKTPQAFCRFPWEQPNEAEMAEKAKQYRITPEEEAALNRILEQYEAAKALPSTEKP